MTKHIRTCLYQEQRTELKQKQFPFAKNGLTKPLKGSELDFFADGALNGKYINRWTLGMDPQWILKSSYTRTKLKYRDLKEKQDCEVTFFKFYVKSKGIVFF